MIKKKDDNFTNARGRGALFRLLYRGHLEVQKFSEAKEMERVESSPTSTIESTNYDG